MFVVAFSGYCHLFWQLKPAHVLICVGEDDTIAWSKMVRVARGVYFSPSVGLTES